MISRLAIAALGWISLAQAHPVDDARKSFLFLDDQWHFAIDPQDQGISQGWMSPTFDDSAWGRIESRRPWEEQGYAGYDGYAWYRVPFFAPLEWRGSQVRFETDGAGDEYDVFVQGKLVRHQGGGDFGTIALWPSITPIEGALEYGKVNELAIRVLDHGWSGVGGLWRRAYLRRIPPLSSYRALLPSPVLENHPDWVNLYWEAWRLAWEKVSFGDSKNGFSAAYMDEGFNEQVYQWDSCFITQFGRYGRDVFPVMGSLDNFYGKQRGDGYIQRSYSATTGDMAEYPTEQEPAVNPPIFAWAEWRYYDLTGDDSRLARVLPVLERYFDWMKEHLRTDAGQGFYFQTGAGSGMDNLPRGDSNGAGWIDSTLQQALAARYLAKIAAHVSTPARAEHWQTEYAELSRRINAKLWNDKDGFYHDLQRTGELNPARHIGALWALVSGVADGAQASRLVAHLENPAEFKRRHVFPALPADDPLYFDNGHYWLGGVWAPTNYMTIKGLEEYGYDKLAHESAKNFLGALTDVYQADLPQSKITALDRIDGPLHTLWECYAPELNEPCGAGQDGSGFGRGNFVGWTGVGPISLLIENVIGMKIHGASGTVRWDLREDGRVGLERFKVGETNLVSLVAEPAGRGGRWLRAEAKVPFTLELAWHGKTRRLKIEPGTKRIYLGLRAQTSRSEEPIK